MFRLPLLLALVGALAVAGCIGAGSGDLDANADDGDDGTRSSPDDARDRQDPEPPEAPGDDEYAPGWPSASQAAIRPGATIADGSCTSNFLFRSPDNRTLYLGTAAHCLPDAEVGAEVTVADRFQGRLAYSSWKAQERVEGEVVNDDNDFALVALPNAARDEIHPAVRGVGGPTGLAEDVAAGDRVLAHGNSSLRPGLADPVRPREGYVTDRGPWLTSMYLAGPGVPGDSGSPVLAADGTALGLVVHLEILPSAGSNNAANLPAVLDYANEHGQGTYELVTWEALQEPMLPKATS